MLAAEITILASSLVVRVLPWSVAWKPKSYNLLFPKMHTRPEAAQVERHGSIRHEMIVLSVEVLFSTVLVSHRVGFEDTIVA